MSAGRFGLPKPERGVGLIVPFFAIAGLALLPWTVWLTQLLPARHTDEHWRALWVGFDLALAGALIATAIAAVRRSRLVETFAAVAGTLLLCDAWFDTLLESGNGFWWALAEAGALELPMAAICFWVALDARKLFRVDELPG